MEAFGTALDVRTTDLLDGVQLSKTVMQKLVGRQVSVRSTCGRSISFQAHKCNHFAVPTVVYAWLLLTAGTLVRCTDFVSFQPCTTKNSRILLRMARSVESFATHVFFRISSGSVSEFRSVSVINLYSETNIAIENGHL